jgi:hypothetical protein
MSVGVGVEGSACVTGEGIWLQAAGLNRVSVKIDIKIYCRTIKLPIIAIDTTTKFYDNIRLI